jgi:hypothetical protein
MKLEVTKKQLDSIVLLANDTESQIGFADDEESTKRQNSWVESIKQIDLMLKQNNLAAR